MNDAQHGYAVFVAFLSKYVLLPKAQLDLVKIIDLAIHERIGEKRVGVGNFFFLGMFDLSDFEQVEIGKARRTAAAQFQEHTIAIGTQLYAKRGLVAKGKHAFFFLPADGRAAVPFGIFSFSTGGCFGRAVLCRCSKCSDNKETEYNNFFHVDRDIVFKRKFRQKSMTSTVVYEGDLRTTCTHLRSGNHFETDAPTDNNGKGERFSPTDLMATSLATCMLTVMGIKARALGFDLNGATVEVEKIMKAEPRRVGGINLFFHFPEALQNVDEKTKQILKHTGKTCPVQHSLHPDIEVKVDWGEWG